MNCVLRYHKPTAGICLLLTAFFQGGEGEPGDLPGEVRAFWAVDRDVLHRAAELLQITKPSEITIICFVLLQSDGVSGRNQHGDVQTDMCKHCMAHISKPKGAPGAPGAPPYACPGSFSVLRRQKEIQTMAALT